MALVTDTVPPEGSVPTEDALESRSSATASGKEHREKRRRTVSPLTRRILAVNLLALGILVAGLLYVGQYRKSLIETELASLTTQAEMFAAALGEGAVTTDIASEQEMVQEMAKRIVRRLVETTGTRARLFDNTGKLVADSRRLLGPRGIIQIQPLPPPDDGSRFLGEILEIYDRLAALLPGSEEFPAYKENAVQKADDYPEALSALAGEVETSVRRDGPERLVLSAAVPVQRYKRVLGALVVSKDSRDIDAALYQVRLDILKVFAVALAVTVMLSLYLAGTIARPIRRLAAAAESVRGSRHRQHKIPDFAGRHDEIGELAMALSDMTEALWNRMDAIESFAADVAHEIKNPLTSLRSAVETALRIQDPEQQRKLMAIIADDVQRLDRLISDISGASRLDAELSRADTEPVDLGAMLQTLVGMYQAKKTETGPDLRLDLGQDLVVNGMGGRLAQVFRNLIDNAVSFSPPGGTITVECDREDGWITAHVDDQGPGIPEGNEEAIFERFYTRRPGTEKFGTHSGLGLSICRQIVQAHGGTISAETFRTEDGRVIGSRFTVRLPTE